MTPISEARRYLDNARKILSENGKKEGGEYSDPKYVRMAGHTAYSGVLIALDRLLGKKAKGRKDVEWYKSGLSKIDRKLFDKFSNSYIMLHLAMSYDGLTDAEAIGGALKNAETIIDWVGTRVGEA